MTTVAAIILHYWPERTDNVKRIISDLKQGTEIPDEIIVFNNNKMITFPSIPGVIVINSTHNFHCLIRHALGLVAETDFGLFLDDDLTLQRDGLEYFLDAIQTFPHSILGFAGRQLNLDEETPYTSGYVIGNVESPFPADIVLGRIHFCHTTKLVNSFRMRNMIPGLLINGVVEEDILLSLSNKILDGADNFVLPSRFQELSECGVGYHYTKDHYPRRDKTCRKILGYE